MNSNNHDLRLHPHLFISTVASSYKFKKGRNPLRLRLISQSGHSAKLAYPRRGRFVFATKLWNYVTLYRSSRPQVLVRIEDFKISRKFLGKYPSRSPSLKDYSFSEKVSSSDFSRKFSWNFFIQHLSVAAYIILYKVFYGWVAIVDKPTLLQPDASWKITKSPRQYYDKAVST